MKRLIVVVSLASLPWACAMPSPATDDSTDGAAGSPSAAGAGGKSGSTTGGGAGASAGSAGASTAGTGGASGGASAGTAGAAGTNGGASAGTAGAAGASGGTSAGTAGAAGASGGTSAGTAGASGGTSAGTAGVGSSGGGAGSGGAGSGGAGSGGAGGLDPELSVPASGDPCTTPGSLGQCTGAAVCRISSPDGGTCESCTACGNLHASCASSDDCDILFQCYQGTCRNICPLGTGYCGAPKDCLDVGHATHGVCKN